MSDALNKFVERLKEVYKDNIVSIILYGSKASGEDTGKYSDYNLMLILKEVKESEMPKLGKALLVWLAKGNNPPLVFSKKGFLSASDVFPIEFSDIKDNHKILYGEDALKGLTIQDTHLRHECEFELRSKLLKLRQAYMASIGKESKIKNILIESVSSLLVLFKTVVKLYGKTPGSSKADSLDMISELTGVDTSAFKKAYAFKKGGKINESLKDLMEEYIAQLGKIAEVVDKL